MVSLLGITFGEVMSYVLYLLIAIVVFAILIFIHELGHYTFGKIFKFKINEFSIGFGKALWQKQGKDGVLYAIRIVPLGGYCAFEGEDGESAEAGAFNTMAWWKRAIVLFGGVFFNFISACIIAIPLLATLGTGITKINSFQTVEDVPEIVQNYDESDPFKLHVGDIILEVNGVEPTFLNGGSTGLMSNQGEGAEYTIKIRRDQRIIDIEVKNITSFEVNGKEYYSAGIGTQSYVKMSVGEAFLNAVPFCGEAAWECVSILGKLLTFNYDISNLGGPITAVKAIGEAASVNMIFILMFFVVLSINLAVFNALPIPALDGARIIFVLIEAIRKKPIKREVEQKIHMIGLMILFGFVILVDFLQLFIFRYV